MKAKCIAGLLLLVACVFVFKSPSTDESSSDALLISSECNEKVLSFRNGSWYDQQAEVKDVELWVNENYRCQFSISCPDSMSLNELDTVLKAFSGHSVIYLQDHKGAKFMLDLNNHCSRVIPEIEPMVVSLWDSEVAINKTELLSYDAFAKRLTEYRKLAYQSGIAGEFELDFRAKKSGSYGQLMLILRQAEHMHIKVCRGYVAKPVMIHKVEVKPMPPNKDAWCYGSRGISPYSLPFEKIVLPELHVVDDFDDLHAEWNTLVK